MKTATRSTPSLLVSLALSLATALPLAAQITPQNDPANLAGERVSAPDLADTLPINHGAPALQQLLRKLRTRASFMLIVAHPDDEDNGMLTYLSRGQGARVATLTLNRGEGGQNLMSADFGDALGLIRTQELLAADRYMGVDQFFGTEVDFGFSKTKEEAFAKWGHDRVLYDAVRAIRLYRPLVIASVFIGAPSDGHGQHQVSGEIAQEAFKAAGDPNVFPDQIAAGLLPWQPLKVYARSPFARIDTQGMYDYATSQYVPSRFTNYVTGKVTETVPKANVIVPEGDTDPLLGGESYAQFGREGRNLQRSQIGGGGGPGRGGAGGRADVSYHRYGSHLNQPDGDDSALESSFFDGIDISIKGIASLARPDKPIMRGFVQLCATMLDDDTDAVQKAFSPEHPENTAAPLRFALLHLDDCISQLEKLQPNNIAADQKFNLLHELRIKRVQLNNALVLALGITLTAETPTSDVIENSTIDEKITLIQTSAEPVIYKTALSRGMFGADEVLQLHSARDAASPTHSLIETSKIGPQITSFITHPYFFRKAPEDPVYQLNAPAFQNSPAAVPALSCYVTLDYQGVPLTVGAVAGHGGQPMQIVPPFSVNISPHIQILPKGVDRFAVRVSIKPPHEAALRFAEGHLELESQSADPTTGVTTFNLKVPSGQPGTAMVEANAAKTPEGYSESYRALGYPGLVYTNYFTPAADRIVAIDVITAPKLNIAYLAGTGDDVPSALEDLGIHPHLITTADLTPDTLKSYDAVILGVRAYTAHPELTGPHSQALIDYARQGGNVIVQFNNGRYGDAEAPFPITVASSSGDHAHDVIDESAPVTILAPNNPLLTWPNRITTADFDNWVEERGHAFAGTWSSEYTPLLETHDPNQQPQRGGLLIAHVGKGSYIYLGLALYRQLPQGVPGAYRLLANLISAAKNPTPQPPPTH